MLINSNQLMTKNTSKNYLSDIKEKYEIEKNGDFSHFLNNPTPVSIKDFCIDILKSSNSKTDLEILKHFFSLKGDEKDKSLIEKFDNDKFRPICNFFNGKTKKPKYELHDLMALLVDLKPRPLNKFLKGKFEPTTISSEKEKEEEKDDDERKPIVPILGIINNPEEPSEPKPPIVPPTNNWFQKYRASIFIGTIILITAILGINHFTSEKECMAWMENHYEEIDCNAININKDLFIVAKDDNLLQNFKKAIPCDTTKFERNGKVCLWYSNTPNGEIDFFTYHGVHPEYGKTLKEVTPYIMNKYGKGPCK